jgi:ligand-binding sensor domain-containing protein
MRRSFALTASVLFVALAWCVPLFGLEPDSDISQYAHTSWKIRDGFLQGYVLSIAQTPDGYLWLGTERGLFRFDGVRAVRMAVAFQATAPIQLCRGATRGT